MFTKLHRKALILVAAICVGGSPFVTVAGCDTSNGSFKFYRDDDEDYYYDDGYYYDDWYYYDDGYYGDCYYYEDCY